MFLKWYENYWMMYTLIGGCALGLFLRLISNLYYRYLVKATKNVTETKNKMLKKMKLKFDTCYQLGIGVHNVDSFVDKQGYYIKFCGVLLSTWDNICGQIRTIILSVTVMLGALALYLKCGQAVVMYTSFVSISCLLFFYVVDKWMDTPLKQKMIRANLSDYFENYLQVRLEKEVDNPELVKRFQEYYMKETVGNLAVDETIEEERTQDGSGKSKRKNRKERKAKKAELKEAENRDELNRRREARKKKEELKKEIQKKREEEHRKLELARIEEERRRLELKRKRLAEMKEEEVSRAERLREEMKILEQRRKEDRKRKEEKRGKSEQEQLHKVMEAEEKMEEIKAGVVEDREEQSIYSQSSSEIEKKKQRESKEIETKTEETSQDKTDAEIAASFEVNDEIKQRSFDAITKKLSKEEQQLIEDVLKELFQ